MNRNDKIHTSLKVTCIAKVQSCTQVLNIPTTGIADMLSKAKQLLPAQMTVHLQHTHTYTYKRTQRHRIKE